MEFSVLDKSNYLKGLLVIAKKDNKLTEPEKKIIRNIALKLGFATDFYEDTLRSLLANKYIPEDPIKFSHKKIAESFVCDGLKLAFSDGIVPDKEIKWLKQIAETNGLTDDWFGEKLIIYKNVNHLHANSDFALYSII
jgi:tellurite resistance protein